MEFASTLKSHCELLDDEFQIIFRHILPRVVESNSFRQNYCAMTLTNIIPRFNFFVYFYLYDVIINPRKVKGFCSYVRILNSIQNQTFFVRPMFSHLSAVSLVTLLFAMSFSKRNNSQRKNTDTITHFCFLLVCLFVCLFAVFFVLLFVTSFWRECTRNQVFNNLKAQSLSSNFSSLPFGSLPYPAVTLNESRYSR